LIGLAPGLGYDSRAERRAKFRCSALLLALRHQPLNINPLKSLIERFVDFEAVRAYSPLQLVVSATNVQTGRLRIFPRQKIPPTL
jgi:predicted acylesterase/phospholipase RssA